MKSYTKVIICTALLSVLLSCCGMGVFHVDVGGSKVPEKIDAGRYGWSLRSIACAASEGKNPAGDDEINKGASSDQSNDSEIQEEGFITLLRILSIAAMSILLVWYIRKRMRL